MFIRAFYLVPLLFLISCSSPLKKECPEIDWFEVGRQEGKVGALPSDAPLEQSSCSATRRADHQKLYESGRNAGLAQYCTSKNGYEIGLAGESYYYVCPIELEEEILLGYQKGRKIHLLKNKALNLEKKITGIASLLKDVRISQETKAQLNEELSEAKKQLVSSEKQIYKLRRSRL